jgi:hypothetical protein
LEVGLTGEGELRVDSVTVSVPAGFRAVRATSDGTAIPAERVRHGEVVVLGTARRVVIEVEPS